MVCVNAIITDQEILKNLDIIPSASTGLIIEMMGNIKMYEKINQCHQLYIKYYKLSNYIDSKMTNDIDNINIILIEGVIDDYNNTEEGQDIASPSSIRKNVKNNT